MIGGEKGGTFRKICKSRFDLPEHTEKGAADENAKDEEIGRIKSLYLKSGKRSLGKMKLLSIVVPCFNSEKYVRRCLDSLLTGGDDVEIIVVDDGSADRTGEIAERYASRFPEMVTVVHKENGGHGSGVNMGLRLASGKYFKVVDSDDWLDEEAYRELLEQIRRWSRQEEGDRYASPDLVICNYTYNHLDDGMEKTMSYRNVFPERQVCTWDEIKSFRPSQYLIMHALLYRTEVLRKSGLVLPEHTFYVDNIFAYYPLPYVKTLYYMDIDLYQYYLGREDQSVNETVMIGRLDQQIRVTKLMLGYYDVMKMPNRKLRRYMIRYLEIMMTVSSILAIRSETEENLAKKKELWQYLKQKNLGLYIRLRWGFLGQGTNLPGKSGRKVSIACYKITQKFYGFN